MFDPQATMADPDAGPVGYDPMGRPVNPAPPPHGTATYGSEVQQALRTWIVENQTLAVLAGFAVGVFIGAMMRK